MAYTRTMQLERGGLSIVSPTGRGKGSRHKKGALQRKGKR